MSTGGSSESYNGSPNPQVFKSKRNHQENQKIESLKFVKILLYMSYLSKLHGRLKLCF